MASLHVMIVEDEPLIGAAMQMFVEDPGGAARGPFMTLWAGLAGLAAGRRIEYARLKGNLGQDASRPITEILAERAIPFTFTSGEGLEDIEPRFHDRPVFTRPVDEAKLKAVLLLNFCERATETCRFRI